MRTLNVPANEHGVVRVFSLSMSAEEARNLKQDAEMQRAVLGVELLNERGVEVFQIADLGDVGLMGYLREGVDAVEDDLKRDRARLGALEGWVMIVYSSAFDGQEVILAPAPELTLIGRYGQTQIDTTPIELTAESAQPYTGAPTATPPQPAKGGAGSTLVVAGIIVLLGLAVWWLLT